MKALASLAAADNTIGNPTVNILIFALFVVATLAIVFRASRNNRTATEYYAGGRSFTGPQNGIALSGAQGHQRELQRVRAVGATECEFGATEAGQPAFQFGHIWTHYVFAVGQHFLDARVESGLDPRLLGGERR